ncbi:MAG: oxidoreductase, molybdopterin binding protein [Marmoricola sp.]|nr:oxidoreductase, molybdopterin binding protein [Marmoricola sp.]
MRDDGWVSRSRRYLAAAGVITGISGLVTAQSTVWAMQANNGPVVAVASAVRDKTPGHLAINLVHLVGHQDKPLLITGTTVVLLAICAWIGTQAEAHPLVPELVYFGLAVIGLFSVMRLPDSTVASTVAVVVGLITWVVVHRFLTAPIVAPGNPEGVTRRVFVQRVGLVGLGAAAAGLVGDLSSRGRRRVEQARRLLHLPVTRGKLPRDANVGVPGIATWRTPNDQFYRIDTAFTPPSIAPSDWSLRVHGMVDKEIRLSYDDLVGRRITEDWVTLCCVSNEVGGNLISNAWWSGVLIREILAEAGVKPGADAVLQTSKDGWTCGTPLVALTDPNRNAMLAVAMNGDPLPVEHGFPVRMVVPGLYGYVSATKWLVDLEVTQFGTFSAYWTQRGWGEMGPVKTESRIDVPRNGAHTATGTVRVGGCAWAQHTGIETVEFQIDGGPWQRAELGVEGLDTWVQWTGSVEVAHGSHHLVVRATDKSGYTQTSVQADVLPDGATGWHTIRFTSG